MDRWQVSKFIIIIIIIFIIIILSLIAVWNEQDYNFWCNFNSTKKALAFNDIKWKNFVFSLWNHAAQLDFKIYFSSFCTRLQWMREIQVVIIQYLLWIKKDWLKLEVPVISHPNVIEISAFTITF